MLKFLRGFSVFLIGYFVLYVTASYYIPGAQYILPIIKELLRLVFVAYIVVCYASEIRRYLQLTRREGLLLLLIAVWGVLLTIALHGSSSESRVNIAIGLKYGLYSSLIFYTAAAVGYTHRITMSDIEQYIVWLCRVIMWSLVIGLAWQGLKRLMPNLFYDVLGYGPLGDYQVGQAHPIYYRTGPGGYPRFSGLMSGPNNLGYLLVAYGSVILIAFQTWRAKLLYYGISLLTVSRAALLGLGAQIMTYVIRRPKLSRMWTIVIVLVLLGLVIALSVVKGSSTREHVVRTWGAFIQVIQQPWGIGLGSSGPGMHRNGRFLPENFYLQLMIDYGAIPFIGRCVYRYVIIRKTKSFLKSGSKSPYLTAFIKGFVGLLIVGLFLHVFEDSVVNYLFFIPFGLLRGQSLRQFAKSQSSNYNSDE